MVRLGTLARGLKKCGHTIDMLTTANNTAQEIAATQWSDLHILPASDHCRDHHDWLAHIQANANNWDWLIVDHYPCDSAWFVELPRQIKILALDDVPGTRELHAADVILNHNPGIKDSEYGVPAWCGAEYTLVREAFHQRQHKPTRHQTDQPILVIIGGTDAGGLSAEIARMVLPHAAVAVAGKISQPLPAGTVELGLLSPPTLAATMAKSRCGIIAAGSTVWEAACVGLPFIAIETVANQRRIAHTLKTNRWAPVITPQHLKNLPQLIRHLDAQPATLDLSPLIDHHGPQRISDQMVAMTVATKLPLTL